MERFKFAFVPQVRIATVGDARPRNKQFVKLPRPATVKARLTVAPAVDSKLLLLAEENVPPVTLTANPLPLCVKSLSLISNSCPDATLIILPDEPNIIDILQLFTTSWTTLLVETPVEDRATKGTDIAKGVVYKPFCRYTR